MSFYIIQNYVTKNDVIKEQSTNWHTYDNNLAQLNSKSQPYEKFCLKSEKIDYPVLYIAALTN